MRPSTHIIGWLLAALGTGVYLLTLAPSLSFWDCGEFIATSYGLQVGHPPGAPFYQLMAHLFMLLASSSNTLAWWSNAFSAVCGGLSVMLLYWNIRLLTGDKKSVISHLAAITGAMCYLFCDTAWFSAVESEVYSMAMLMSSLLIWVMLRWYRYRSSADADRWLVLLSLLLGLSVCVHLLCLLTLPALLLLFLSKKHQIWSHWSIRSPRYSKGLVTTKIHTLTLCIVMLVLGLTPYVIVPIRAAAQTPINYYALSEGKDCSENFLNYVRREQYAHAPLFPRIWREGDKEYARAWRGGHEGIVGEMTYFFTYQLGYMYFRYLLWNFSGRYDSQQGFGSLQHGQFITGIPPLDRLIVGSSSAPPEHFPLDGRQVYYLLPFLLGLIGLFCSHRGAQTTRWVVGLLFLFGGVILSFYLNHPIYEPRERDYAYILSFYAFCIWIAFGSEHLMQWISRKSRKLGFVSALLLLGIPILMACQNWKGHDRSQWRMAYQVAENLLAGCSSGGLLFTYGDNDTFPLWYIQQVEGRYTDIDVKNINLIGPHEMIRLTGYENSQKHKPIYFTHFAHDAYDFLFSDRWQLAGFVYQLRPFAVGDAVNLDASVHAMTRNISWNLPADRDVEEVAMHFLIQYWRDVLEVTDSLCHNNRMCDARSIMSKTLGEIPPQRLLDPILSADILSHACQVGLDQEVCNLLENLRISIRQQLQYYTGMSESNQYVMHRAILACQQAEALLDTLFVE